ncbi:hypothetical protein QTP88_018837 [Uroleucon formosanum]
MTLSLVLFLTLRFRRPPSTHALVSRVVVVVGVAVFAAVALFGVAVLSRYQVRILIGDPSTEQLELAEGLQPPIDESALNRETAYVDYSTSEADWTSDDDRTA